MKKCLLVGILLSLIILGGCSTTNKFSQDELFQKKQECIKYEKDIQKDIEKVNLWWKNEPGVGPHSESLSEIFYSPVKNSCLYSTSVVEKKGTPEVCSFYKIYDFLNQSNGDTYLELDSDYNCDYGKTLEKYNQEIKELKLE